MLGGGCALGLAGVLLALRRGGSLRALSLGVCGMLVAAFVAISLYVADDITASHAAVMLLPLLAVYLLGIRMGLVITGVLCLNAALLMPLVLERLGVLPVDGQVWGRGVSGGVSLLLGWCLSALFSSAREAAAVTARENEHKLLSLLESTSDPVCALDVQGRLSPPTPWPAACSWRFMARSCARGMTWTSSTARATGSSGASCWGGRDAGLARALRVGRPWSGARRACSISPSIRSGARRASRWG